MHGPPLFIVFNAASGSADARANCHRLGERLRASGRTHDILLVEPGADLGAVIGRAVHAARAAHGVVVAAGGDGTQHAVAQAVWNADLPMAVLPQGTFNYFGRAHGMPTDLDEAVDALLTGRIEAVPLGMAGDRVFLVNASMGLYPKVLQQREQAKQRFGRHRWVAVLSGLATVLRGRSLLTLELHAGGQMRVVRTRTLLVGRNALQWRQLGLHDALAVEPGRLAAITVAPASTWRTLWLVLRGAVGQLDGAPGVDGFAFERLVVQPRRGPRQAKVAMDGEIFRLPTPLEFRIAPRPLQLLVPQPDRRAPPE
jgi:diacylglycerol kinase family enzyme